MSQGFRKFVRGQEDDAILKWLTPIDYALQQSDHLSRQQPGTGQWVLDCPEFREWRETDKKTLFCYGFPGTGKTIIASMVVDHLQTTYQNYPNQNGHDRDEKFGIAFVYYDFQMCDQQKPVAILASLVRQLVQEQPCVPESVKYLYNDHKSKPSSSLRIGAFSKVLQSIVSGYTRVFIVIDALDECREPDRSAVLSEISQLQAEARINLFTTSRPGQRIQTEIEKRFPMMRSVEISARDDDVGKYIDGHMLQLSLLDDENDDLSEETKMKIKADIKTKIIGAANGVFLLAQIHFDGLIDKVTPNEITVALDTLPKGKDSLAQAYGKTINRIRSQPQGFRLLAERVLSLLTGAKRLLALSELRHALAVKAGASTLNEGDLPITTAIVSACAGLVTVDKAGHIVRLLHDTTREYLETHMFCIKPEEDPRSLEDPMIFDVQKNDIATADTQGTVMTICVTYLSFDAFEGGFCQTDDEFEERLRSNPLYNYAAQNWGHHARKASLSQCAINFLESRAKVEASSQALLANQRNSWDSSYSQRFPRHMTGLHLAAYFGLEKATNALLSRRHEPDLTDSDGRTPLSYAAEHGYGAVVKLLLDTGKVNADSTSDLGLTPLSYASKTGYEAVVKLLFDTGKVNVDSGSITGRTPL
ncbi:ankyrin, partial [Zopfia rhizophila CBS 207.26]